MRGQHPPVIPWVLPRNHRLWPHRSIKVPHKVLSQRWQSGKHECLSQAKCYPKCYQSALGTGLVLLRYALWWPLWVVFGSLGCTLVRALIYAWAYGRRRATLVYTLVYALVDWGDQRNSPPVVHRQQPNYSPWSASPRPWSPGHPRRRSSRSRLGPGSARHGCPRPCFGKKKELCLLL